jgi:dipeptide transport system ATP-binding protein
MNEAVLESRGVGRYYPVRKFFGAKQKVKALDGVSFQVEKGKTTAIVGESGCGKSTLARLLLGIEQPSFGQIFLGGRNDLSPAEYRKKIQMVFQDPSSSVNPRKKAGTIIEEPLLINTHLSRAERKERALTIMQKVGLRPEFYDRYPHMFSGGQRQRIGIARALILRPEILVLDEPVSALDISIQAQVLNLLLDLQDEFGLSYVFITHDLSIVRHIADQVIVMYLGRIVEAGPREEIFSHPRHPYTKALLASTPSLFSGELRAAPLSGELPSPLNPPPGCSFHLRCPIAEARCKVEVPELRNLGRAQIACHFAIE